MSQINSRSHSEVEDASMEDEEEVKQSLGQRRYWTKVFSLNQPRLPLNMKFDIRRDQLEMERELESEQLQIDSAWHPQFSPQEFHQQH
jgi:hypothetical protein